MTGVAVIWIGMTVAVTSYLFHDLTVSAFIGAAMLGSAAYHLSRGCGIPAWRGNPSSDAVHIGLLVYVGVLFLMRVARL